MEYTNAIVEILGQLPEEEKLKVLVYLSVYYSDVLTQQKVDEVI